MKATGIVRRIDDLGRVVIPKEIRRTLRIREGDPLEIFVDRDGEVILKKYSPVADIEYFAQEYADSLAESTGHIALIADEHEIVAVAGAPKKNYLGKEITEYVQETMSRASIYTGNVANDRPPIEGVEFGSQVVAPIKVGDASGGSVILLAKDTKAIGALEVKLAETAAGFLSRQLKE